MWSDDDDFLAYSPYYFGSDMEDSDVDVYNFDEDDFEMLRIAQYVDLAALLRRGREESKLTKPSASSTTENTPATATTTYQLRSLQDLCCRVIALRFPFAYIEHRSPPIPDELQLKIIGFSFPEDEQMMMKYAQFSRGGVDVSLNTARSVVGNVKNLNQIGFRLSATVDQNRCNDSGNGFHVTVYFDRGKITSAHCSCDQPTNWCVHVIATCLARIKDKNTVTIRMPVSDSLNFLDRDQLIKFAQYLLYEHQNESIIETAQQLLDKLLSKEQKGKEEDINAIAGAPDPTAGPGLDEEAHWFVCRSGFQSRCKNLMFGSNKDLGFLKYVDEDNDVEGSVKEVWERNCLQQPLVRDEMDVQLDDSRYGYSKTSSQQQSIRQVLETIADMLQDDFMSAVSALTVCTEQLIQRLTVLCKVNSPRSRYHIPKPRNQKPKSKRLCGSLAGGFTPRLSDCTTVSDELSRLWRLAVLSPGISVKGYEEVVDQLRTLNERVSVAFVTGLLHPWHGLEVAMKLSSIDWNLPDFQQVLKGQWTNLPVVSSCMAIQLTCQSKSTYVSKLMARKRCSNDVGAVTSTKDDSNITLSFYSPHCIAFSSRCNIDIHSVCSMIEAINASGHHRHAMCLTVTISYALVSFYKKVLFGLCDASSMPVSARCSLGTAKYQSGTKADSNKESDCPAEIGISSDKPCTSSIWPEDTLLAISTFAFLFELLSKKPDLVDASIAKMRTKLNLDSCSSRNSALDCPKSAMSLKFQLGVVGLFLQRLPASSLHHEVEEYHYECWLTYHLICCSPADADLSFLTRLGQHVSQEVATPSPAPQSSLSRVIFHHLFKSAPAVLSKTLSEQQHVGLKAALNILSHVNKFTVKDSSPTWMLFEYANCRLWAKLAEVVLRSLADSSELLDEAMRYVLQPNGMLGAQSMDNVSVETTSSKVLSRLQDVELLSGKCRVAHCLGRVLSDKQGNSIRVTQYKAQHVRGTMTKGESSELEIPRKIHVMNSEVEKALKLCAVQIVAHSLWLQGFSDKDHMCQADSVRWLTDLVVNTGVESLECLVQCKGDVTTILKQGDLLNLCEKVLRRLEPETQVKAIVQNILMSLLQKASHGKAEEDMKSIISFCRGRRCDLQLDLLPWICTRLQTLNESKSSVPFEVLMDASHGMLEHYKERLARTEIEKRKKKSEEKLSKTNLFLRRLPAGTTDVYLHNLCSGYGSIVSTKAVVDKETNEFKGYGFVNFETAAEAQRAVKALKSKGIQAQMAKQPEKDPTNLYFCRLPKHFYEAELESLLKGYGKVITTRVLRGAYRVSKGVAFARMENKQICKKVIKDLHGKKIQGSVESLVVNFADLRQQSYDSSWPINRRQEGRPFYGEDSDDDETGDRNPFRTAEAHPFLETAFNLGMMGLEKLGEKLEDPSHDRAQYHLAYTHVSPVKKHLSEFCRLVCYLVKRKWLTEALIVAPGNRSSKTEDRPSGSITVNPSSCQLEDDHSKSASKDSCDKCFLQEFVTSLINNVDNPLRLFEVLQELGVQMCADIRDNGWQSVQETQNVQIQNACQSYPPLNLLLKKDLDAFSKLLLGQPMSDLVAKVTRTCDQRELEPSEIINELRRGMIVNTNLQEVLQAAKRAFSVSDSSEAMFKNLTEELANKHPILEQLLERVLKDDWTGLYEKDVKKKKRKKRAVRNGTIDNGLMFDEPLPENVD